MLVDAHCHLTGQHLAGGHVEEMLARARAAGVSGMIAVGTNLEDSKRVLGLVRCHEGLQASLGVHPHEADAWNPGTEAALEALLQEPDVRFVGETGLDWHYDLSPREAQAEAFRAQVRLARRVGKPLMIHTREARDETLRILREEKAESVSGIFHCFSEDMEFAAKALDMGFYLSFSGILTFPKKAQDIRDVAAWAPEDRILVETDSPYLAPVPHRGKPNEPAHVKLVAEFLATLRHTTPARLCEATSRNLEALCGWPSF